MNMEQAECSETSAYKIQTPENYPEESIQHLEHGEVRNQEYVLSDGSHYVTSVEFCTEINLLALELCI